MNHRLFWLLGLILLGGCLQGPVRDLSREGHLESPSPVHGEIPEAVTHAPFLGAPQPSASERALADAYTIGVSDMPVRDLLYALARDANLNVDIHPGVAGEVTLNAIDQTLPRILDRIAQQVDLRFEVQGSTLVVTPDRPYLHTYHVNYINLNRQSSSNLRLTSQIVADSVAGTTDPTGDPNQLASTSAAGEGKSTVVVDNFSRNRFWETLIENIRGILIGNLEKEGMEGEAKGGEGEGVQGDLTAAATAAFAAAAAVKASEVSASSGKGAARRSDGNVDGDIVGVGREGGAVSSEGLRPPMVVANPQSGLITVRATARQHEEIQSFLDQVMAGARRQVRIEATVVEVRLNDQFRSGVDWSAVRDVLRNRGFVARSLGNSATVDGNGELQANDTTVLTETPVLALDLINPTSGVGNVVGTIHNVTATIQALRQFGDVQVLSTPKIVSLNNQLAVLKVVDNEVYFTLEKREKDNNNIITTTFTSEIHTVPVGLVMSVLPQISPEG
ncbi:MAG: type II and III secretion system protein, partial [Magnetococcales bacterium]|nr:type II and III secretion system protein [Magnetococcales bacterium]